MKFSEPSPNASIAGLHRELTSLVSEITMDIQYAEISETNAEQGIRYCTNYLNLNSNPFDIAQVQLGHIQRHTLTKLFDEATGLKISGTRYITALKVWFGLEEEQLVPIFQPICLTWVNYDSTTGNNIYSVLSNGAGKLYRYMNGAVGYEFIEIDETQFDELTEKYEENIDIRHSDTQNYSSFIKNTDINACVFPFQVIYSLMHFNSDAETIRIFNNIRKVSYDLTNPVKHTMILSCYPFEEVDEKIITLGKYANRSHLCPPCTNLFGYPA